MRAVGDRISKDKVARGESAFKHCEPVCKKEFDLSAGLRAPSRDQGAPQLATLSAVCHDMSHSQKSL